MRRFHSLLPARSLSTSSVWEAGRKAREAARALAALPNEDRNQALERVAAALESSKVSGRLRHGEGSFRSVSVMREGHCADEPVDL